MNTEVSDFTATRTGSTLVLSYRETEHVNVAGQAYDTALAQLDVCVRQGGRWRLQTMTAAGRVVTQIYRSGAQALRARRVD